MKAENWIRFEYNGVPREAEVRTVKVAKNGSRYAVCNAVDMDVKEIVVRSFIVNKMQNVKVIKSC